MIASKGGHVVNIASLAGHAGTNKLVGCVIIIIKIIIIVVRRLTIAQASLLLLVWTRLSGLSWPCRSTHNCHLNLTFSTITVLWWHLSLFSSQIVYPQGHSDYIKTTVVCPYYISTGMFSGVYVIMSFTNPADL